MRRDSLRVTLVDPAGSARPASGPGDLSPAAAGWVVVLSGSPEWERDFGRWAAPLGSAIVRGARAHWTG